MTILQTIIIVFESIHFFVGVLGIPVRRILKGGDWFLNSALCWVLYILWGVVWIIVIPIGVSSFSRELPLLFPEGPALVAVVAFGWIPSFAICLVARITYSIVHQMKKRRTRNRPI